MKIFKISLLILVGLVVLAAVGVYSGMFNFSADDPHWGMTQRLIELARERSIATHATDISVPANLADEKLIASGAGEYAEMCTGCHLAPGMKDTEMRTGLYPKPPNLSEPGAHATPGHQFWIIKHGLKMTGMPAWGLTHDDERIWSMVAFLQKLPGLSPAAYHELVEAGEGGHHHEGMEPAQGGESGSEEGDEHAHHHEHAAAGDEPGSRESHLAAAAEAAAARVDDFQKLLAHGDAKGAGALLDPAVLIYESGGVERSRAEYASHHLKADSEFLEGADVHVISRDGNAMGDLAWVATEAAIKTKGSKPMELVTTETMVLTRGPQGWRVAHIHWSSRPKTD
jgi:ketosteroid isomerase-like protein/mono/diheme cytochrome c family protein